MKGVTKYSVREVKENEFCGVIRQQFYSWFAEQSSDDYYHGPVITRL